MQEVILQLLRTKENEVVTERYDIPIYNRDLNTLHGLNWLNDLDSLAFIAVVWVRMGGRRGWGLLCVRWKLLQRRMGTSLPRRLCALIWTVPYFRSFSTEGALLHRGDGLLIDYCARVVECG